MGVVNINCIVRLMSELNEIIHILKKSKEIYFCNFTWIKNFTHFNSFECLPVKAP